MSRLSSPGPIRRLILPAASALCLTLVVSPAAAQQYDNDTNGVVAAQQANAGEHVQITAPRFLHGPSMTGAPIEDVAISKAVPYNDLNLRTARGAHELRNRIRSAAHELCWRMNIMYPIAAPDNPPCYRATVKEAMLRANTAIREAGG